MARLPPLLPLLLCGWAAAQGSPVLPSGKCGTPMQIKNAEIKLTGSCRLRYSCVKDYKRKAGTSNLIVCTQNDTTKQYRWTSSNLNCIRDPTKPQKPIEGTTENFRQKTETSTPTRKSAAPQTSVKAAMVTIHPSGSPTINPAPASSTADTILPTAAGPLPDVSVMTDTTTKWLSPGTASENTTLQERTTMQDSHARTSSQPSFRTPTQRNRLTDLHETAVSSRLTAAARNTTPVADSLDRQKGSHSVRIGLSCLALFAGVFIVRYVLKRYCHVRFSCFPWHRGNPPEEQIAMSVTRSEERGRTSQAASYLDDPGPCSEGAQMLSPHCAPATG